ncbi:hypothetical protein [Flectobacillus roseus]|uniref:DUF4355 domain-containing protein n=1 Tax=Flectobacillus roseus TaxID=502259 RepID=A0ABT6YG82_9BACT|nr:hypothetical protein [Flectobacillus roseus]MDI9862608.1 hypothetical protein [Flectobacillus roseus]
MNTKQNIEFIKKVTNNDLKKLDKDSIDNYHELKSDSDNFAELETIFEIVPDAELMLDAWVQTAKKKGIDPFEKSVSKSSKSSSPKKGTKTTKSKVDTASKREEAKKAKLEKQRDELKQMVSTLKQQVIANAKFKEKLAGELKKHLSLEQSSLSGSAIENEISVLKKQKTFYSNLLKGDKSDFKAIALRVGLDFKKSKPKPKKQSLSGVAGTQQVETFVMYPTISGKKKTSLIDKFKHWWDN